MQLLRNCVQFRLVHEKSRDHSRSSSKTVERASRRDSALDVTKEFTVVDENQLTAVQKKVQSWSATAGPKGGNPTSNGKGSGGVFPAKGKEGGKGDGFLFGSDISEKCRMAISEYCLRRNGNIASEECIQRNMPEHEKVSSEECASEECTSEEYKRLRGGIS